MKKKKRKGKGAGNREREREREKGKLIHAGVIERKIKNENIKKFFF